MMATNPLDACPECGQSLYVDDPDATEPTHVWCDICGGIEHPADLTPDWDGETGAHRSCEDAAR